MNGYASCVSLSPLSLLLCCRSHFLIIVVVTIWFKISDWCYWHVTMILMLSSNNFVFTSFNLSQWLICPRSICRGFSQSMPRSNDFINLQSGRKGACNDEVEGCDASASEYQNLRISWFCFASPTLNTLNGIGTQSRHVQLFFVFIE